MTVWGRVCTTTHICTHTSHMHTSHIYPKALKCPTLLIQKIPGSTLSEGHYRLEMCQNVWDTVPRAQSILHVCHWIWLPAYSPETHTYIQNNHTHINLLNHILAISPIILQVGKPLKGIQCFKKLSVFLKCSLSRTVSSPVSQVNKGTCSHLL